MLQFNATFLIAIVSFVIFIFIMNIIFYKPVLAIIEERKRYIRANYDAAEKFNKDSDMVISDKNKRIADSEKQAKQIVLHKTIASNQDAQVMIKNAKKIADERIDTEKNIISNAEKSSDMSEAISDISDAIAKKLIGEL